MRSKYVSKKWRGSIHVNSIYWCWSFCIEWLKSIVLVKLYEILICPFAWSARTSRPRPKFHYWRFLHIVFSLSWSLSLTRRMLQCRLQCSWELFSMNLYYAPRYGTRRTKDIRSNMIFDGRFISKHFFNNNGINGPRGTRLRVSVRIINISSNVSLKISSNRFCTIPHGVNTRIFCEERKRFVRCCDSPSPRRIHWDIWRRGFGALMSLREPPQHASSLSWER